MPRFSARTIAIVRRNVNDMLTETCKIERAVQTRGTMGEVIVDYAVVDTDVPCRVIRLSKSSTTAMNDFGSQENMIDRYRLVCPAGTVFVVDDRVTVGGQAYEVASLEDGLTDEAFVGVMIVRERV